MLFSLRLLRLALAVFLTGTLGIAAAGIAGSGASAQTPRPSLPAPAEPGMPLDRLPPPVEPQLPPPEEAPAIEPAQPPAGAEQVRFVLQGVVVDGATAYPEGVFGEYYQPSLGREITLADFYDIAAAIEAHYRDDGYVLTRVVVPAQTVTDGVFRLRVIEGFISEIVVEGDIGPVRALIESTLARIAEPRPVNISDIERYLLLVNDLPGIAAYGVLRPAGGEVGSARLTVAVERDAWAGFALADNYGSRFTGPWAAAIGIEANAFTAFGERTELVALTTPEWPEQIVGQLSHEMRIGSDGLTFRTRVSYGYSEPGFELAPLDVINDSLLVSAALEYPLVRSRAFSAYLGGGFEYIDTESDVLGELFTRDRLRVLFADVSALFGDDLGGSNFMRFGVRRGLDIMNASQEGDPLTSRVEGSAEFTSLIAEYVRSQPLVYGLELYTNIAGQYGFEPLLSIEEFDVGSFAFGRGYDPAELTGDHGLGGTAELRFNGELSDLGSVGQWLGRTLPGSYQLYGFYDFGVVWNEDSGAERSESLASAGGGLRLDLADWLRADLGGALPLTRSPITADNNEKPLRFLARITAQF